MGFSLSSFAALPAGMGLDLFGTEKAQKDALQGQKDAMGIQSQMHEKDLAFQKEQWEWQKGEMLSC